MKRPGVHSDHQNAHLEESYPLARNFYVRFLPVLALLLILIVGLVTYAVWHSTRELHLRKATEIAQTIASDVAGKFPEDWTRLLSGEKLAPETLRTLAKAFEAEQHEYRLIGLKVYALNARTLYSHQTGQIGTIERGSALVRVLNDGRASALKHVETDGTEVFELYVPYHQEGRLVAVFELYEPVTGDLMQSVQGMLWDIIPTLFVMLAGLLLLFIPVVSHAQKAISARTDAIVSMRRRLERLVSRDAVERLRTGDAVDLMKGERRDITLFYSDIRGFTGFCETNTPEVVIKTLQDVLAIQLEQIEDYEGDVDKIIGDAILARFEGPDRYTRALSAAVEIQRNLRIRNARLLVGIGVYSGPVVCGFLGSGDRLDYTVIGDSVNAAARLSSAAKGRDIVADKKTAQFAGRHDFRDCASISVKGRIEPIAIAKWIPS